MTRVLPPKAERHRLFGSVEPIEGTKPKTKEDMPDLQNKPSDYFFPIQQVGISKVKYPVMVESGWAPETQTATAEFRLTTNLGADYKGINMSRLTEQLHAFYQVHLLSPETLRELAAILAREMNQTGAQIEVTFPWFFVKKAPETDKEGLAHAELTYKVEFDEATGYKTEISLEAAVTTLCPCSKEISEYSAHNQRSFVTMSIRTTEDSQTDWKTALVEAAESNASSILYPVLKRPDEKAVTERAYENPRFVEDLARLVAADLYEHDEVREFTIHCRNEESIHQHDAVAKLHYNKDA